MLIIDLCKKMNEVQVPYLVVGGYALALHGIVRATVDVDIVVSLKEKHLIKVEKVLHDLGLQSRLPIDAKEIAQFHKEFRVKRNLIAWSFVDFKDPTRQVDILIYPPIRLLKSEIISVHGTKIRVATKRSLLAMKQAADRPQDQLDIQKLKEALSEKKN